MSEIQKYASNSNDLNFLFVLILVMTYLLYEVAREILDKDQDVDMSGGMMMRAHTERRPELKKLIGTY